MCWNSYRLMIDLMMKRALNIVLLVAVLWLTLGGHSVMAQDTLSIRGTVVNGNNMPVPGVSVGVEGSLEFPDITDDSGSFLIRSSTGDAWLNVVPSADYKSKRIHLNKRTKLTIYLTSNSVASGDDPIPYFSRGILRKNMISAFSALDPDQISHAPVLSIDQYLQGRVSGMHVTNRSGFPGSGAATFTRGVNSLTADSRPLYIVDGMPLTNLGVFSSNIAGFEYNALLSVNTMDISGITVLKDALLSVPYGSMAPNGVILIESLDPSATETVIEIDYRSIYSLAPKNQLPQMNADQHKTLISELLFSTGSQLEQIQEDYPSLFLTPEDDRYIDYQHNTNWQDYIFTNTLSNHLNVNVKGGDEIARYGLSFGYINSDGIIRKTGYDGYNLRFVGLLNIFTWLKMNAGVSMNYGKAQIKESGISPETSPILSSLSKSPMLNPYQYDDLGQELPIIAEVDEIGVSNPVAVINNQEASSTNFNFTSTLGFNARVNDKMNFQSNFGLNYNIQKENNFKPNIGMEHYDNDEAINVSQSTNNTLSSFYTNNYLVYRILSESSHSLTSVTGMNILSNTYELDWAMTRNAHENDQYRQLQDGSGGLWELGGDNRKWNRLSMYENLSYSFRDRYLATASLSLDGSSRVGRKAINTVSLAGTPFGFFYSVGAAWRISNEAFLRNFSPLEELKLRLSYSRVGNDDLGESTATNYYKIVKFRETTGLYPALLPNEELSYEVISRINGGLDLSLLGNRISASIDVYRSVTDNLLVFVPLEAYFGYDVRPENNGKIENKGLDVHAFMRIINRPRFQWDIEAWYSLNRNKILEIEGEKLVSSVLGGEVVNQVGEKAHSFYGYIFNGVYATTQEAEDLGLVNERMVPYQAGDAIYEDRSGPDGEPDGIINDYDKTILGSSMPDYYGGISNSFTYGRWSLSAFFQYVSGNELYNYIRYQNENMMGLENQSTKVLSRWQYEGQQTEVPRAVFGDPVGNTSFSSRWIEDGSYVRLKNLTLSFTMPEGMLKLRKVQIYISASNLLTLHHYLGYDPEFAHSHNHITQGIDYGQTPQPRQFLAGIKIGL